MSRKVVKMMGVEKTKAPLRSILRLIRDSLYPIEERGFFLIETNEYESKVFFRMISVNHYFAKIIKNETYVKQVSSA